MSKIEQKLAYTKLEKERPLAPAHEVKQKESLNDIDEQLPLPIRNYSKSDGELSPSLLCIISGGTKREKDFLNELESKQTFRNVRVIFVSTTKEEGGLTPSMMCKKYDEIQRNKKVNSKKQSFDIEDIDSFFMVTDVDHYEEELAKILLLQSSTSTNYSWIISNPCIETWIYYCFKNNPYVDLAEILTVPVSKRSSELKRINGTFNKGGGLDPRRAFENIRIGIANARTTYKQKENGLPCLLCTNMFILAEELLKRLGDEFDFWRKKKEERKYMRNKN